MNRLVPALRRLTFRVWSSLIRKSVTRRDPCRLFGLDLIIDPGVLHPRHFASSRILARHLMGLDLSGRSVADVGTGSGLLGLLAARAGAQATMVDINPAAVACAFGNAARNGLGERVSVIRSDVFDGLPEGRQFDFVITNPPFYTRDASSDADRAFAAGTGNTFFAKLAEGLPGRLTGAGVLVLIQSSDADFEPVSGALEARGLRGRVAGRRRGLFETLTIREFARPESRAREPRRIEA